MTMQQYWEMFQQKLASRSLRERQIFLAVTLLIILLFWNYVFSAPLRMKNHVRGLQVKEVKNKAVQLEEKITAFKKALATPPEATLLEQKKQLEQQRIAMDQQLVPLRKKIMTATDLPLAIEALSVQSKNLSLNDFEMVPDQPMAMSVTPATSSTPSPSPSPSTTPTTVNATPPTTSTPAPTTVPTPATSSNGIASPPPNTHVENQFFTVTFRGNYFATLQYLKNLEKSNWLVFIDEIDYAVTNYPLAVVKIKLHLLSTTGN